MADDVIDVLGEEQNEKKSKPKPNPLLVIGLIVVIGTLGWYSGMFGNRNSEIKDGLTGAKLDVKQSQKQEERDRKQQQQLGGLNIGEVGEDKTLGGLAVKVQESIKGLKEGKEDRDKIRNEITNLKKEMLNKLDANQREMREVLKGISQSRVENDFRGNTSQLPMTGDTATQLPGGEFVESPKKKFFYQTYANPQTKANDKNNKSTLYSTSQDLVTFDPTKSTSGATPDSKETNNTKTNTIKNPIAMDDSKSDESPFEKYDVDIPAASRVKALMAETIACPIGSATLASTLNTSLSAQGAVPVTFIVTGVFEGPQGYTVDLGHIHIQGYCVGIRSGSRGRIQIKTLSYVGADGKSIELDNLNGYVQDRRDMQADLAGVYIDTRNTKVWKAALADGIAAIGNVVSLSEFQTTQTADGSNNQSLTGSIGTASAGAFVAGGASRLVSIIEEDLKSYVDTIVVPQGTPIYFKTLKKIEFQGVRYKDDSLIAQF